jgi:hypothetical protein
MTAKAVPLQRVRPLPSNPVPLLLEPRLLTTADHRVGIRWGGQAPRDPTVVEEDYAAEEIERR